MKWATAILILLSVSMSAFAQILLKTGLPSGTRILTDSGIIPAVARVLINPWIAGGLGLYFLGAIVWLFVLARSEVSYAYPFVSFGFILTMLLGAGLLGEQVGLSRAFGTVLIVAGIICVARS
jgi:drug/metabolite transporter (DMT)-like permease